MSGPRFIIDERNTFESRRAFIIQYVIDHPNCTKADVIRYMKGRAAVRTTHGLLISLIKEGKIIMQKKHMQTHLLSINHENNFVKLSIMIEELYDFVNLNRVYFHGPSYFYYKTKPPLKYRGIDGFENSYRELFNIIIQVLASPHLALPEITAPDWRLLGNKIKFLFLSLAFYDWDKITTKEVVDLTSKNIEQFFYTLNKEKSKLIKMMERDEIDRLNENIEFGKKLIELINKFKKEYSYIYRTA